MLASLRKTLTFEMTIAEWIGTGLMLGVPYLVLGVAWSAANMDRFSELAGLERIFAVLGAVVCWPVLLLPGVCAP